MLDRSPHVPALLAAKVNRHPLGISYTEMRLTGERQRRITKLCVYVTRVSGEVWLRPDVTAPNRMTWRER